MFFGVSARPGQDEISPRCNPPPGSTPESFHWGIEDEWVGAVTKKTTQACKKSGKWRNNVKTFAYLSPLKGNSCKLFYSINNKKQKV